MDFQPARLINKKYRSSGFVHCTFFNNLLYSIQYHAAEYHLDRDFCDEHSCGDWRHFNLRLYNRSLSSCWSK